MVQSTDGQIGQGMQDYAYLEILLLDGPLKRGKRVQHARTLVSGGHASCGISLRAARGELEAFLGLEGRSGNQPHSVHLEQHTGQPAVLDFHTVDFFAVGLDEIVADHFTLGQDDGVDDIRVHRLHMSGAVRGDDGMCRADLVQIITVRVTFFRDYGVVIVGTQDPSPGLSVVGLDLEQSDQIVHINDRAERWAVQVNIEQIDLALAGKMAVSIHEAGQHGLAAQIDDFVDLRRIKIALRFGVGFRAHKDDLAIQRCDNVSFFGICDVFGFLCRFRNGIDFTIVVYGIGNFVRSIQLHTAAENHRHGRRERQNLLLCTVFHEHSSCKKLTLPGAFLLVPFPDSDSRKAYFPDFG